MTIVLSVKQTASDLIRVNENLDEITPIYEFGPKLLEPKRFESRGVEDFITFKWQDAGPLAPDQVYSLILVRDDLSDEESCYHWQTTEPEVTIRPEDYGCTPGAYNWGVSIATKLSDGSADQWRDDSEFDERNPLGLGIPHPGRPYNSNSGGGNGGGAVGSDPK